MKFEPVLSPFGEVFRLIILLKDNVLLRNSLIPYAGEYIVLSNEHILLSIHPPLHLYKCPHSIPADAFQNHQETSSKLYFSLDLLVL
jgi:hypothetical protein